MVGYNTHNLVKPTLLVKVELGFDNKKFKYNASISYGWYLTLLWSCGTPLWWLEMKALVSVSWSVDKGDKSQILGKNLTDLGHLARTGILS